MTNTERRKLPILMSAPMILGLQREIEAPGTGKTETRRLAWGPRFRADGATAPEGWKRGIWRPGTCAWPGKKSLVKMGLPPDTRELLGYMAPSIWQSVRPGDLVWVKETWARDDLVATGARYYATDDVHELRTKRPSIHMPTWASRFTLAVEASRVEPLNAIDDAGALAEGVIMTTGSMTPEADVSVPLPPRFIVPGVDHPDPDFPELSRTSAREMYAALWDVLHGSGMWLADPDVVAIRFRPHAVNVNAMEMSR